MTSFNNKYRFKLLVLWIFLLVVKPAFAGDLDGIGGAIAIASGILILCLVLWGGAIRLVLRRKSNEISNFQDFDTTLQKDTTQKYTDKTSDEKFERDEKKSSKSTYFIYLLLIGFLVVFMYRGKPLVQLFGFFFFQIPVIINFMLNQFKGKN